MIVSLIVGFAAGIIVAGGIGALFTTVGVVVRLALISGTEHRIRHYENCIILGTTLGVCLTLYHPQIDLFRQNRYFASAFIGLIGIFMGMFVGCLAMALSESLDVSTVYFRRLKIKHGIWVIILAIAFGKFIGGRM